MKNSILYLLISFLIFTSCKQQNEEKAIVETNVVPEVVDQQDDCSGDWDPETNNCLCSLQIYGETAFIWQSSWVSYYNYNFDTMKEDGTYDNSPSFNFNSSDMNTLYKEITDSENSGVLISYIIATPNNEDPQIPGLAIQNIVNCAVDPNGSIFVYYFLESQFNGGDPEGIITQQQLDGYKANWLDANNNNDQVFTIAEGYIYSWSSLNSINATTEGMTISYGLRTLESGEEAGFIQQGNSDGRTGSIVYCNIIYGGKSETNADGTSTMLHDFARPCPVYCHE